MSGPEVLIFGTGAVGTICTHVLLQANCSVTTVCRSNYTAASTSGFHISSKLYGSDIHIQPSQLQIVKTPAEAAEKSGGPFDYILVCSKALPDIKTSETIAPAVTEGKTTIVLVQNGISIEEEYATRFPSNPLLTCVAYIPTTQISPGVVEHGDMNMLEIGPFPTQAPAGKTSAAAGKLVDVLNTGGATAKGYDENAIQERRWFKLLLNAPWNPICALTLSRDVAFLQSSEVAEDVVKGVQSEVVALSNAQNFTAVTNEAAEAMFERMIRPRMGTAGIEPSMLVDVLWTRRMEVEVILGNPVRIAKKLGVAVPRMDMLYALTKGLDEAMRWRSEGKSLSGLGKRGSSS